MRLFFAVALTDAVREKLAALEGALRSKAEGAPVSWVVPENMHLTLRFLGETPEKTVPRLREAAGALAGGTAPFSIVLEKVGTFGGRALPKVVWVGVRDDEGKARLRSLAEGLEKAARKLGFAAEERPFAAHATLARIRDTGAKKTAFAPLVAALDAEKTWTAGTLSVSRFVLYESRMQGPRPPEYVELESFELQGIEPA